MIILLIDVCVRRVMNVISYGSLFIGMRRKANSNQKTSLSQALG